MTPARLETSRIRRGGRAPWATPHPAGRLTGAMGLVLSVVPGLSMVLGLAVAPGLAVVLGLAAVRPADAQNPAADASAFAPNPSSRLLDQEPYDVVVLNDKERTTEKVLPLDLPGRRVPPAPRDDDVLRVRLWRAPEMQFDIRWGDIAEVRLFERMLLDEAARLAGQGRFDEAFDYFVYLRSKPSPPEGLREAEDAFFLAEVRRDLETGDAEKGMAGCLRLHARMARLPELPALFGRATEAIVKRRLQEGKPTAARVAVDQMASKFPEHSVVVRLRKEIADGAADLIRRAEEAAAAGRTGEAQSRIVEVLQLAPDSKPAAALFERLVKEHPRVVVGVVGLVGEGPVDERAAAQASAPRPDDWSASRIARLVRKPALDCVVGTGETPSVRYVPGWGSWSLDDRDPELARFEIAAGSPPAADAPAAGRPAASFSAYDVVAWLSEGADPDSPSYRPDWGALGVRLSVESPTRVLLHMPHAHPRPEAIVARVLDDAAARPGRAAQHPEASAAAQPPATGVPLRYIRRADEPAAGESTTWVRVAGAGGAAGTAGGSSGLAEIEERRFADEEAAVAALVDGSIDVVDRIAPWQAAALAGRPDVTLRRYGPPLVHYLRLRPGPGPLARPAFRRALEYAIDREWILKNELRPPADDRGVHSTGCVFPSGRAPDDPLGYGGSFGLPIRGHDPQQAFILARTADEMAGAPGGRPLVVSYPPGAVAERVCRRLQNYWRHVGIEVELRRRPADSADDDDADISYMVLATSEPLTAAVDCFADPRHVPALSASADALRRVFAAESFAVLRKALVELQQAADEESLVIPLWQLNAYAAHRRRVTLGPTEFAPTTLYQFVDGWRVQAKVSLPLP